MELYPAIDLRGGAAVRLTQGDFDRETNYGDPVALAESYIAGGAPWIHVVDLEAARTGEPWERPALEAIVALGTPVQTGGGLRTEEAVAAVLHVGVARAVLGTAAIQDPALAARFARKWPNQIAVGLDYKTRPDGMLEALGHGWAAGSGRSVTELLEDWAGEPLAAVVSTSVDRDGMLDGPDLDGLNRVRAATDLPVIASGGVSSLADLQVLAELDLAGVIVGKALVERRFSVEEAVAACAASG
ncbi:MAG TPA: 1-(5-phosphoribosyl)-5-[(5-phosphoribosylamino)methylideneamino] imidazole-4-carboxamide isomerase [Acidimicrobiales bacterium]|nr:1-(5-phosphoribosyl)-5-[(5-phosphoribosylamino)methylideneamino] imidazole-4-carboxamide isomerase [Acidimicrobiales bacterium]